MIAFTSSATVRRTIGSATIRSPGAGPTAGATHDRFRASAWHPLRLVRDRFATVAITRRPSARSMLVSQGDHGAEPSPSATSEYQVGSTSARAWNLSRLWGDQRLHAGARRIRRLR
jgi:hypothetical protein